MVSRGAGQLDYRPAMAALIHHTDKRILVDFEVPYGRGVRAEPTGGRLLGGMDITTTRAYRCHSKKRR